MIKKLLEINYCIECPHCNGFFFCSRIGRKVDEIPEDCPLPSMRDEERDGDRLDFLEQQTRVSRTGVSFDYAQKNENGQGGYRFMRYHKLHQRKNTIREAIDESIANEFK